MSEITKKYVDSNGVKHLWNRILQRYESKLDNVSAKDDSIVISDLKDIKVNISAESDNAIQLKTSGNKGLYVQTPAAQDTYSIIKENDSGDYSAVYNLYRYPNGTGAGVPVGASINIPKSMIVESGAVETKTTSGVWGPPGTYIHLVLSGSAEDLYVNVGDLIEYVTSGSQPGDMVVLNIDNQHRVTATITDGTITKAKLDTNVKNSLDKADSSVQTIVEGDGNGQIKVDGVNVNVHGLNTAAYQPTSAFDSAGMASAVLGSNQDSSSNATVYGVKQYAAEIYTSIQALSNTDIDNAIAAANS